MPTPRRHPVPPAAPVRRARVAGRRRVAAPDPVVEETDLEKTLVDGPLLGDTLVGEVPIVDDDEPPKPTGKPRPSPRPRPASADDLDEPVDPPGWRRPRPADDGDDEDDAPKRYSLLVPIALAVVTVLLGGVATVFAVLWSNQRTGAVASNTALTDNAGTAEVKGEVISAVNTTFSYDFNDVGKTEKAAQNLLTGAALCQYNALFKVIQQQAPTQKLVLTTQVTESGVQVLRGGTARVLLVVNQSDRRAASNQPVQSQAALAVDVVRQGGTWKISGIDTFNGQNATPGCPTPK